MAPNRFATTVHRNTNKITLILIYAALEWILIVFLLCNSLFSYLINKFAAYFGLKPPCFWCTRIDHFLDPAEGCKNMHRDLLCEIHSKEISRLGYCSTHRKLVESHEMCEDCSSSRPEFRGSSKNFSLWMKGFGVLNGEEMVGENGGVSLNCSCCGACLDDGRYSSYALLKSSSCDALEHFQMENLITFDDDDDQVQEGGVDDSCGKILDSSAHEKVEIYGDSECVSANLNEPKLLEEGEEREEENVEEEKPVVIMKDESVQVCIEEDVQLEAPPQHLEFFLDYNGHTLVPIELINSMADEHRFKEESDETEDDGENKDQDFLLDSEVGVEEREPLISESGSKRVEKVYTFLDIDLNEEPSYSLLHALEMEEDEDSLVFHAKDSHSATAYQFESFPLARWPSLEANEGGEMAGALLEQHSNELGDDVACEEVNEANSENERDVSIGTEIPDLEITDEMEIQDSFHAYECTHEDPSSSSTNLYEEDDHGPMKVEEQLVEVELQSLSVEGREVNEIEEDKFPDTPTSVDSLDHLHKKFYSGTEESLDGSVTSELEGNSDGVVTVEQLKAALRAERKTLQALYAELEEERSASAVAANQTMAMINRLQEEKAAMQMEALQYQRMMEEQSEYDQEALQLLNELMVRREKEKEELERELDGYRKIRASGESKDASKRSGFSSASCSNGDESDGLSIDLNQEAKEEDGFYSNEELGHQTTPINAVVNLEQSLADFEDERMSILKQLKFLEEKLSTLDDDDDEKEQPFHEENGGNVDENGHPNGHANGFPQELMNLKKLNQLKRIAGQKGKSLLPLFDAMVNRNGVDSHESKLEMENKKVDIEDEVDHLYERLQALETDREILKHCISSLKKGDKGIDLLQEILHHLRDLRNVTETRSMNK